MHGLRASPVGRVLVLLREVFGREAERAAGEIDAILRRSRVRVVAALDRAVRDADTQAALGQGFVDVQPWQLARLDRLGEPAGAVLGVLSLVRDGHTREAAVLRLQPRFDRLATAFLINRVNDYVRPVAELAWGALTRRLVPRHAGLVIACLPLVDRMAEWTRAAGCVAEVHAFVRSGHPEVRAALWAGLQAGDPEVVVSAAWHLAVVHRGGPEIEAVLAAALTVREPRVRRWAAALATDVEWTPPAVFQALAARLAGDRTPGIRAIGVRGLARLGDRDGLVRAAFDTNAEVRHQARVAVAAAFTPPDYRGEALRTLAEQPDRGRVLAALALLSEFGRSEDAALVERFLDDPRAAVAREARRTRARLP